MAPAGTPVPKAQKKEGKMSVLDLMLGVFHRILLPFIALIIFAGITAEMVVRLGSRRKKKAARYGNSETAKSQ
jgi:hypothetical protein